MSKFTNATVPKPPTGKNPSKDVQLDAKGLKKGRAAAYAKSRHQKSQSVAENPNEGFALTFYKSTGYSYDQKPQDKCKTSESEEDDYCINPNSKEDPIKPKNVFNQN